MAENEVFDRCIYCFAPKPHPGPCEKCGYDNGLCCPPGWWLTPGTVLKGRYVVGKHRKSTQTELTYLGWDLQESCYVQIVEFFPEGLITRDITHSEQVSCIPGNREEFEDGCRAFREKAMLYSDCVSQPGAPALDLFTRNGTCYYVRRKENSR